jgi:hypothetical protein
MAGPATSGEFPETSTGPLEVALSSELMTAIVGCGSAIPMIEAILMGGFGDAPICQQIEAVMIEGMAAATGK